MIYAIAAVLALILDQGVKYWTINHIPLDAVGEQCVQLIPGVLHMTNVRNTGAAFSILPNSLYLLIGISVVFIIAIVVLINTEIIHTRFGRMTASLVAAGAMGNCLDRILFGYVVDMFEFELFSFAVFNVADIFITVCGLLFCLHVIIYRDPLEKPREKKKTQEAPGPRRKARLSDLEREEAAYYGQDAPPQPASRPRRSAPPRDDPYAGIPHRGEHRSLEEDLKIQDPSDPFAEWDAPAPKSAPPRQAAPARPENRRPAAAVQEEDDFWRDLDEAVPVLKGSAVPSAKPPAGRSRTPAEDLPAFDFGTPARSPAPAPERSAPPEAAHRTEEPSSDDSGLDSYSLEDILAEFR